jgi:hypothetical protein
MNFHWILRTLNILYSLNSRNNWPQSVGVTNDRDLLSMQLIYWYSLRWYITHSNCHDDRLKRSSNIRGIISIIWETMVLVLLMRRIYHLLHWHTLRWHDIYIPIFMKIRSSVQTVLRLCLRNLRGGNVGITDVRDLLLCRWDAAVLYDIYGTYQVSWRYRHSSNIKDWPQKYETL